MIPPRSIVDLSLSHGRKHVKRNRDVLFLSPRQHTDVALILNIRRDVVAAAVFCDVAFVFTKQTTMGVVVAPK